MRGIGVQVAAGVIASALTFALFEILSTGSIVLQIGGSLAVGAVALSCVLALRSEGEVGRPTGVSVGDRISAADDVVITGVEVSGQRDVTVGTNLSAGAGVRIEGIGVVGDQGVGSSGRPSGSQD